MIAVVIALYNKANYIQKAIKSVVDQTYKDFQLIIVDDGSEDEPLKPVNGRLIERLSFVNGIDSIKDKICILTQANQGVSAARNNGVQLSAFDYIAFLDADDWWEPTYLEQMKSLIDEYPDAGLYSSSYYKYKNQSAFPAKIGVGKGFKKGYIDYYKTYSKTLWMPVWTGATIIRKSTFNEFGGFNPKLKLGEDFHLWARVAMKYPVAFLNKPLAYYNQDVDITKRAVGSRLYLPEQHVIFQDFGNLMNNPDFKFLYERLALYGLLPYYLNSSTHQIFSILKSIDFSKHEFKYFIYYKFLPKYLLRLWFRLIKSGSYLKGVLMRLLDYRIIKIQKQS